MTVKTFLQGVVRALARPDVIFLPKARPEVSRLLYTLARNAPAFHDSVVVPGIVRDYSFAPEDYSAPVREPASDVLHGEAARKGRDVPPPPLQTETEPTLRRDESLRERHERLRRSRQEEGPDLNGPSGPRL